jgi:DNA-binding transcriptional LysR family regulator
LAVDPDLHSLCPEIDGDFSYLKIRREPVVALLAESHPAARQHSTDLSAMADDGFLMFPRELAPRLYDFMVGLCRRADFEPNIRSESFHTGWELQILADVLVVALAPASVTRNLPPGIAAVRVEDPPEQLETALIWHTTATSSAAAAFRQVAESQVHALAGGA